MYSKTKYLKIHTIYDLRTIRILLSLKSGVSENHKSKIIKKLTKEEFIIL